MSMNLSWSLGVGIVVTREEISRVLGENWWDEYEAEINGVPGTTFSIVYGENVDEAGLFVGHVIAELDVYDAGGGTAHIDLGEVYTHLVNMAGVLAVLGFDAQPGIYLHPTWR